MAAGRKKENSIFFNHSFDKKRLKALISWVFKKFGEAEALRVLDLLKETGFRHATKAGISIGVHDLTTPIQKSWLISESQLAMNITDRDFIGAKITATERSQRIIDTWHRASESLSKQVVDYFGIYDQFNPVYIMALSGARGNFSQVRQLIGMRGLMADQQGKIVNFPILSNLREGLTLTEYFISCSGARKGLVDTALRTADTGYLTRRLVDVSHNVVVKRIRCNTNRGIAFKSLQSYNKVLLALKERLVGRVLAEDIELEASLLQKKNGAFITSTGLDENESKKVIAKKDQEISPKLSLKIARVRDKVFIRSPLTCGFTNEVCQLCYGWSISQGSLVSLGDAVGVIAAQSIGEPGTQLTMRTFHTGGVFSGDLLQEIRAPHPGTIQFSKAFQGLLIRTAHGRIAFLSKTKGNLILSKDNYFTEMPIQAFTMLFVKQGEEVKSNQLLAEYSIQSKEGNQPIKTQQTIFAELSGRVIEDRSGTIYTKPIKESLLLLDPLQNSFSTPFFEETKLLNSAVLCRALTPTCPDRAPKGQVGVRKSSYKATLCTCKGARSGEVGVRARHGKGNQIYKPQILSYLKNEDLENDVFKYVEPVKSGRLGFLKILSTRVGATLDYMCPIKPFDYYLIKKKRQRFAPFERSNGFPFFLFSKPVLACPARFLEARLGTPVVEERKSYGKLHLEEVRRPQISGFRYACRPRTPAKGFGEETAQVRSFVFSKENYLKDNTPRQNKEIRVKKAVKYLHPEYIKENRFFLQTIAEYGDIVEEEYKTKII